MCPYYCSLQRSRATDRTLGGPSQTALSPLAPAEPGGPQHDIEQRISRWDTITALLRDIEEKAHVRPPAAHSRRHN